jgi:hypothetical protein
VFVLGVVKAKAYSRSTVLCPFYFFSGVISKSNDTSAHVSIIPVRFLISY